MYTTVYMAMYTRLNEKQPTQFLINLKVYTNPDKRKKL